MLVRKLNPIMRVSLTALICKFVKNLRTFDLGIPHQPQTSHPMPRISDKRRLENELASAMEEVAMLLDLSQSSSLRLKPDCSCIVFAPFHAFMLYLSLNFLL